MKKIYSFLLTGLLSLSVLQAGNCPGDFNCDGQINATDLLILNGEFGTSGAGLLSDMNCDGTINGADLTLYLGVFGLSCPCAGDMNYDGVVDAADLALIPPYASTGNLQIDFNCDGVVDIADKTIFYDNMDNGCGLTPPPSKGKKFAKDNLFSVYPNPTTDKVFITHELNGVDGVEIVLLNHMGQEIARSTEQAAIDLSQEAAGLYFAQLRFQGQLIHTKNLIKN